MSDDKKELMCEKLLLNSGADLQSCMVCYHETYCITTCCHAPICKSCYLEWLKRKRQCMHCKDDQCDFETWMEKYRVEEEFDPLEYLHNLVNDADDEDIPAAGAPAFTINDLYNVIQQNINTRENPFMNMEAPGDIPDIDESFELQFGFTTTPLDWHGNSSGQPGITATQSMNYSGIEPEETFNQLQGLLQQYQNMYQQFQDAGGADDGGDGEDGSAGGDGDFFNLLGNSTVPPNFTLFQNSTVPSGLQNSIPDSIPPQNLNTYNSTVPQHDESEESEEPEETNETEE